jgi:flagellar motor switch protein FliG
MTTNPTRMNGVRKAAILMALMGEEAASAVYRSLSEKDVQVVTKELAGLGRVVAEDAHGVLDEYSNLAAQDSLATGDLELATRLLVNAFGTDAANDLLQKLGRLQELSVGQLESLQKADPQQLAKFLEGEHPQTISVILAHLDGKQASALLMKLPEQVRAESV